MRAKSQAKDMERQRLNKTRLSRERPYNRNRQRVSKYSWGSLDLDKSGFVHQSRIALWLRVSAATVEGLGDRIYNPKP